MNAAATAVGGSPLSTSPPRRVTIMPQDVTRHDKSLQAQALLQEMQSAIATGNVEGAAEAAKQLASLQMRIHVEEDVTSLEPAGQEISVKVYIEDKEASAGPMRWSVKPSTTIKALKYRMLKEHGFPPEVQRWIVAQRIAKDDETLLKCGVTTPDVSIFMYLVAARAVGLKRPDFLRQHGQQVPSGRAAYQQEEEENPYMTMNNNVARRAATLPNNPTQPSLPPPLPPRNRNSAGPGLSTYEVPVSQAEAASAPAPARVAVEEELPSISQVGWACPRCTYINEPTRPGCEQCAENRPEGYVLPPNYRLSAKEQDRLQKEEELERLAQQLQEEERRSNFDLLLRAEGQDLIPNSDSFNCPICFDLISVGAGVMLRECLHCFCRGCLSDHVRHCLEAVVVCPFDDGQYTCAAAMQDREIKALVPEDLFQRHLIRSLDIAEHQAPNSYHCKTTNCHGWCLYEDQLNFFNCQVCGEQNCLTCKAIHEGMDCREYQEDIRVKSANDVAARQTQEMLEAMLSDGEAMRCPACNIVVQKKDGCDWIRCTMCKMEICWVTKGPRWGPQGAGDVSGGCKCGVDNVPCHVSCANCH